MAIFGNTTARTNPYRTVHESDLPYTNHLFWIEKIYPPTDGEITKAYVYCKDESHIYIQTLKVQLYNSSKVFIGASGNITVPGSTTWAWRSASYGTPISITGGQLYYAEITQSALDDSYGTIIAYAQTPANNQAPHTNTWKPFTFTGTFCMYFEFTPDNPVEEIEGEPPGQIELVDWTNVLNVY